MLHFAIISGLLVMPAWPPCINPSFYLAMLWAAIVLYFAVLTSQPGYLLKAGETGFVVPKSSIDLNEPGDEERDCLVCEFRRPLRAKHCYTCHRCVIKVFFFEGFV